MANKESSVGFSLTLAFGLMLVGLYLTQRKEEDDWIFFTGLACILLGALLARRLTE